MDIRVLGPVEVVAVPALVDGLWGAALPVNPGNALQVRVSKLRRALAAAGAPSELVVTRPPGYLLDIPRDRVDALRFTDQVAAARAAHDADPVAAERLY